MPKIKPYELNEAQRLVEVALSQSRDRHHEWRLLETLYATGTTDALVANATAPGEMSKIIQDVTGVPLDVVNMVLPHINIIVASVVSRDPRLLCEPLGGGEQSEDYAVVAEAVLRYFWNRTHATQDLADAAKDTVVIGNGFLKVGWSYTEKTTRKTTEEMVDELNFLIQADVDLALQEGREPQAVEALRDLVKTESVEVEDDEPYVQYVSPYDMFVPVDARRLWESRWVAQRIIKPVEEVRAELDLPKDFTINLTEQRRSSDVRDRNPHERDVFQYAEYFEFYDMRARRLLIFQLGNDKPLFDGPLPYLHRYPPFVHIANYRRNPSEFWGFGDLKNIAGLQEMLNESFREQMENMRRAGNKVFIAESVMTPEVAEGLASAENNLAIPVRIPDGIPVNQVVMPLPSQPLPADIYQASGTLQQGMASVLGLSDFQRGMSGADRMSGTAAAAVEGSASLRAADKIAELERAAAEVGNLILLLCQEFLAEETVIRVAGSRGVAWVPVSAEMISGEFKVSVEGGSMKAINPATRQQRAMDRANVLVPLLVSSGYDPEPLLRSIARDMGEDPDVILRKAEPLPAEPAMDAPLDPALAGETPLDVLPAGEMTPDLGPQSDLGGDAIANQLDGGIAL